MLQILKLTKSKEEGKEELEKTVWKEYEEGTVKLSALRKEAKALTTEHGGIATGTYFVAEDTNLGEYSYKVGKDGRIAKWRSVAKETLTEN